MTKGRSPLKNPPLRNPGEGLQEQLNETINDKAVPYIILLIFMPVWLIYEWVRHLGIYSIPIYSVTLVAVVFFAISIRMLFVYRRVARNLNRGIKAEKSVGQYLEQFRVLGYQIFHDIPGDNGDKKFNIDHAIIGPKGIFTIETKYHQKPAKGQTKILYDGQQISINGSVPDRNPIVQAIAQAAYLRDLLTQSTGKTFSIRPTVICPGWFVENNVRSARVWVLNEKALGAFIDNQNETLSESDIHLASFSLSRYIQSTLK